MRSRSSDKGKSSLPKGLMSNLPVWLGVIMFAQIDTCNELIGTGKTALLPIPLKEVAG